MLQELVDHFVEGKGAPAGAQHWIVNVADSARNLQDVFGQRVRHLAQDHPDYVAHADCETCVSIASIIESSAQRLAIAVLNQGGSRETNSPAIPTVVLPVVTQAFHGHVTIAETSGIHASAPMTNTGPRGNDHYNQPYFHGGIQ